MIAPPRPTPYLVLVLLLGASAGLLLLRSPRPEPSVTLDRPTAGMEVAGGEAPLAAPRLRGSPRREEAVRPTATHDAEPRRSPEDVATAVAPASARPRPAPLGLLPALAPEAVEDRIRERAPRPLSIARDEVLQARWDGVARIVRPDRPPSEAPDDTEAPPVTAVTGHVVDETGHGVGGAEVILYSSFYLRQAYYDHRVREIGRVVTAYDGAFDLRPIDLDTVHFGSDGEVLATVRHPGYADLVVQSLHGLAPGRVSDVGALVLPDAAIVLRGTVRDFKGRPVAGARVIASGTLNPVEYDKHERWLVLGDCPTTRTDEDGGYVLTGFAPGVHEISFHVNADCVLHVRRRWSGQATLSPNVRAGNEVRGRVVDPEGEPVAAAVVAGGGNWTPTNPDGTFWLDNVDEGPLRLEVSHHAWATRHVDDVATNAETETVVVLERRLARVVLEVVDAAGAPISLVAIHWSWAAGQGPGRFVPDSPWWHDVDGRFAVIVPEGAAGAKITAASGASARLEAEDLFDGSRPRVVVVAPGASGAEDGGADR